MTDRQTASEPAPEPGSPPGRAGRALLLLAGAGAAFVLILLVSTLLARPAGAAVLPTPLAGAADPSVGSVAPGAPSVGQVPATTGTPLPPPAGPAPTMGPVPGGVLAPVRSAVDSAPSVVSGPLTAAIAGSGSVVGTVPSIGPSTVRPTGAPDPAGAQLRAPPTSGRPVLPITHPRVGGLPGTGARPSFAATASHHAGPVTPERAPAPLLPPRVPRTADGSDGTSPAGSGGSPFGLLPPSGPLLLAAMAGGALLAAARSRPLLLDLRSSPPG